MSYPTILAPTPTDLYATPGPHPNGLQATAAGLWCLDQQTNHIYLLDLNSGRILADLPTESDRGSGITFDGEALWAASTYNCKILHIDPKTGATLAEYPSPGANVTGSHGLEWRDGKLWIATPPSATLYQVDPADNLKVLRSFPAPGNRPHGIAWHGDDLWCVETNQRAIYLMDSTTGDVRLKVALPDDAPEPHGMTVWEGHFYYCDANTSRVCRVAVPDLP